MNLYVSNLGDHVTEESLYAIFATHGGVISSRIIKDQTTGGSRSFGFVDMPDEAEARIAMKRINGRVVNGRNVSVTEARLTPAGKENFIRG